MSSHPAPRTRPRTRAYYRRRTLARALFYAPMLAYGLTMLCYALMPA